MQHSIGHEWSTLPYNSFSSVLKTEDANMITSPDFMRYSPQHTLRA